MDIFSRLTFPGKLLVPILSIVPAYHACSRYSVDCTRPQISPGREVEKIALVFIKFGCEISIYEGFKVKNVYIQSAKHEATFEFNGRVPFSTAIPTK